MHEAEDVDEAGDDDDEDGEWRHEVADEDGRRDEHAQRRQAEVAVQLLGYHLVSLPAWKEQLGILLSQSLHLFRALLPNGTDDLFFPTIDLPDNAAAMSWDSNPCQ